MVPGRWELECIFDDDDEVLFRNDVISLVSGIPSGGRSLKVVVRSVRTSSLARCALRCVKRTDTGFLTGSLPCVLRLEVFRRLEIFRHRLFSR